MIKEACVESFEKALEAQNNGADRIELCENLSVGGTTPSYGTVKVCLEKLNIPIFPMIRTRGGNFVYSKEEIEIMKEDIKVVKFFPAENYGGLKTIKAISQPFPNIRFVPTGGVSLSNLSTYLEFGKIAAVGGSWLCTKDLINEEKWDEITRLSKEAMEIFRKVRDL